MRFYLLPFGSAGDFYPFAWMAKVLLEGGYDATILGSSYFADAAKTAGVPFVPLGRDSDFEDVLHDPRLWDPHRSPELVFGKFGDYAGDVYRAIQAQKPDSNTVLLAPCCSFGARAARDKLGVRLITVHLQPAALISMYDTPIMSHGTEWTSHLPVWLKKIAFNALPLPVDRFPMPGVKKMCDEIGLRPPRSLFREWWNSPDGVIGLFPNWFGDVQPDWPANMHLVGFPLYDPAQNEPLSPELEAFLAAGDKPLLVTPGSAMRQGKEFFAAALEAVKATGWRAIFVTRFPEHLPADLPSSVLAIPSASFSRLTPRVLAMVHHGGIGTLAQGLRAGVPHLVMPMAHDQPDNAARLRKLGVAETLYPKQFNGPHLAQKLRTLVDSAKVSERCHHWRDRLAKVRPETDLKVCLQHLLLPRGETALLSRPSSAAGSR